MQKIRGKSNVDHYISTLRAEATFWPCKLACYFPLASSTAAQPIRRRIETYQKVETTCCLHAAFVLAPEIQRETVLNQGRGQDFFRGTHNSPNSFALPRPPPPPKKIPWLKIWLRCKPKRCFFCIWKDISNLYDTSSVACLDPSYNKATQFFGFERNPDNFFPRFVLSFLSRCSAWIRFGQVSIYFESEI